MCTCLPVFFFPRLTLTCCPIFGVDTCTHGGVFGTCSTILDSSEGGISGKEEEEGGMYVNGGEAPRPRWQKLYVLVCGVCQREKGAEMLVQEMYRHTTTERERDSICAAFIFSVWWVLEDICLLEQCK
jgi:hypothetical protein